MAETTAPARPTFGITKPPAEAFCETEADKFRHMSDDALRAAICDLVHAGNSDKIVEIVMDCCRGIRDLEDVIDNARSALDR